MFWRRSEKDLENRVYQLELKLEAQNDRWTKTLADVLDATERLDRVTKRAFRLREQMARLEEEKDNKPRVPQSEPSPMDRAAARAALLRRANGVS
jgi:hypothetical protein